uniref:MDS1 and EVI1 complex locus n=1 Tax=Xiphophorus couchianus TaxID=32473 RepID=A0A3B5M1A2_9TELE
EECDGNDDFGFFPSNMLDNACGSDGDPTPSSALTDDPLSDDEFSPQSLQQASIFFPQGNLTIPLDFELRESSVPGATLGIWSRRKVNIGERFGPYEGEHAPCLQDPTQGWEVRTCHHCFCSSV